jgi:hypothetical protein
MVVQDLVHATDEIRQRHIKLQLLNDGSVAHSAKQYGRLFLKIKNFLMR